jgi:hypothetical protein
MIITINKKEYEFTYSFSKLRKLMIEAKVNVEGLQKLMGSFEYVPLIGSIGCGITESEMEAALDLDTFDGVGEVMKAFNDECSIYFSGPNSESQAQ